MNKPDKKPLKDWLISNVSKDTGVPLELCEEIIGWSYKKVAEAVHYTNSIELSGFGKLLVSQAKIKRRLKRKEGTKERYEDELKKDIPIARREHLYERLRILNEAVDFMKKKLDYYEPAME